MFAGFLLHSLGRSSKFNFKLDFRSPQEGTWVDARARRSIVMHEECKGSRLASHSAMRSWDATGYIDGRKH